MNLELVASVRKHLAKNPSVSYRASELAEKVGGRPEEVGAVLRAMREAREVVSCWVTRQGLHEEEFRITAGVPSRPAGPGDFAFAQPKRSRGERAMWQGREALRQKSICEFINAIGRPVFTSELVEHARIGQPDLNESVIYCAIGSALKNGAIVRLPKRANLQSSGRLSYRYATPAIADRDDEESRKGSGGEAGNGKAGREPAAPRADEATRPCAGKTAPGRAGVRAGPSFGLFPDGSLAIRGAEAGIDLAPHLTRHLFAWLDSQRAGRPVASLLP